MRVSPGRKAEREQGKTVVDFPPGIASDEEQGKTLGTLALIPSAGEVAKPGKDGFSVIGKIES